MIYVVNESLFNNKNRIPEDEKERIINEYKNKDKLPNYSAIDKAAYILCKYQPSDMDKFCNSSDTNLVKRDLLDKLKYKDEYDPQDVKRAKSLLKSITNNSMVILKGKSLKEGSIIYFKEYKKILLPNDDMISYNITSWSFFLDQVKGDLKYNDGYVI